MQQSGDNRLLIAVISFSHTSDDSESFVLSSNIKAYQDGIELDQDFFYDHELRGNNMKEIKKGATLDCPVAFVLTSSSPVEIEIDKLISFNSKPLTYTIVLP